MKYIINSGESITEILDKVNSGDEIFIKNGIYQEKIVIRQNNIIIKGESKDKVIITNDDYFLRIMPDFNECNTFRTYTMQVLGDNVRLENLTVENSAIPSSKYGQAVALHTCGDNFIADNIILKGAQDTLFTAPLPDDLKVRHIGFLPEESRDTKPSRQQFINSDIYGDVDFIFGGATVLFENCRIHCLGNRGYIAAPSHAKDLKYGYLFLNCEILNETSGDVEYYYLARPWRDYGCVAFINCDYKMNFNKERFDKWNNTNRHLTCRFYESKNTFITSEFADFAKVLNEEESLNYVKDFKEYLNK